MWSGVWQRPNHHINCLELRVVLVAVQLLQFSLRGKTVDFMIDNTTDGFLHEEAGWGGGGWARSLALLKLSMRILRLAHRLPIVIVPRHIAGQLIVFADLASRTGQVIPFGMVTSDGVIPVVSQSVTVGSTTSEHIRKQSKSQVKRLYLPVSRPTGSGYRRVELLVAKQGTVCVSSDEHYLAIPSTSEGGASIQCPAASTLEPASSAVGSTEELSEETAPASTDIAGDASSAHWNHVHPNPKAVDLHLVCLEK